MRQSFRDMTELHHGNGMRIRLTIGSRVENVVLVQVLLEAWLGRLGVGKETKYRLEIALLEAVANAIHHGNDGDPEKRVGIEMRKEEGTGFIGSTGCRTHRQFESSTS